MGAEESIRWMMGIVAAIIGGGCLGWVSWVSISTYRAGREIATVTAELLAYQKISDERHEDIIAEMRSRFDRIDNRLDSLARSGNDSRAA